MPGTPAAVSLAQPLWLRVRGASPPREVPVEATPFSIGSKRSCGLVLREPGVASFHCSLVDVDGVLHVVDHEAPGGTFLDGARVSWRAPIAPGATLRLGSSLELELVRTPRARAGDAHALPAPSGDAWGRALVPRVCCPSCWSRFAPEDVFFVAHHADLLGDPVLGPDEYLRFQPTRFTLEGAALDPRGTPTRVLACPRCRAVLPEALLEVAPLFVSLVGAPASGKSHLLAALSWQLRALLPRAHVAFTDVDTAANRVVHEYEQTLFMNPRPDEPTEIDKTQRDDPRLYRTVLLDDQPVRLPAPLQFSLWPTGAHPQRARATRVGRVLVLYDNAGEDFLPGAEEPSSAVTEHLARTHVLLFLFDPTQDPRFAARAGASGPELGGRPAGAPSAVRQETVLREAVLRMRRLRGLSATEPLRRPLIVAVSKLDAWEHLLPAPVGDEPVVVTSPAERLEVATARIEAVSDAVRSVLLELCPELVTTAEGLTDVVRFVPVSSLGRAPERIERDEYVFYGVRPRDVAPRWVAAPLLYCLARWAPGLVTASGPAEVELVPEPASATGCLAASEGAGSEGAA